MSHFSESFQKELGKRSAQLVTGALGALFLVAGFSLPTDSKAARMVLLFLSVFLFLLLASGLLFRYLSYRKISKSKTNKEIQQTEEIREPISETHEKIVELLFKKKSSVENICKTLKTTKEETNYYLLDLYDKGMVHTPTPYAPGPEEWRVSQEGRKYIMEKQKKT